MESRNVVCVCLGVQESSEGDWSSLVKDPSAIWGDGVEPSLRLIVLLYYVDNTGQFWCFADVSCSA